VSRGSVPHAHRTETVEHKQVLVQYIVNSLYTMPCYYDMLSVLEVDFLPVKFAQHFYTAVHVNSACSFFYLLYLHYIFTLQVLLLVTISYFVIFALHCYTAGPVISRSYLVTVQKLLF